jgi:hypothetical protein
MDSRPQPGGCRRGGIMSAQRILHMIVFILPDLAYSNAQTISRLFRYGLFTLFLDGLAGTFSVRSLDEAASGFNSS